jgi:hypothetical protein
MGSSRSLQHGAPACACCAPRCWNRRTAGSPQPGLHPRGHPAHRGGSLHAQLGFRTEFDAAEAQRREVHQHRYTSLDRIIQRNAEIPGSTESPFFTVSKDPSRAGVGPTTSLTERRCAERLMFLSSLGLAESTGPKTWRIRRDFEIVLPAMQRSGDWQKTLAAHGALLSDERLPIGVLDLRDLTTLEGRILVHGEDERSARNYLLMEGTDACVHFIYYTPELETARNAGSLKTNSFVRLRRLFKEGRPVLDVDELGNEESILHNKVYLRETARQLVGRGIVPRDDGWDGWLGKFQKALCDAAGRRQREKSHDLGR